MENMNELKDEDDWKSENGKISKYKITMTTSMGIMNKYKQQQQ